MFKIGMIYYNESSNKDRHKGPFGLRGIKPRDFSEKLTFERLYQAVKGRLAYGRP